MNSIFIGLIIILFDFRLDIGAYKTDFIPAFIGYLFLIRGLAGLKTESNTFAKIRPYAFGMVIYSFVLYALDLFELKPVPGWSGDLLGMVKTVISFYIIYIIIDGIKDTEVNHKADLNSSKLTSLWQLTAILGISLYFSELIPILPLLMTRLYFVVAIVFLVSFGRSKELYEALPPLEFKPDNTL